MLFSLTLVTASAAAGLAAFPGARFYILSYFFDFLYDHPTIGKALNFVYVYDDEWRTSRAHKSVYLEGLFIRLFECFTGMKALMSPTNLKALMRMQGTYAKNFDMAPYIDSLDGKTMTGNEFESFLAEAVLKEINRVFSIVPAEVEKELLDNILVVRSIMTSVTGSWLQGNLYFLRNCFAIWRISQLLRSVSDPFKRVFLYVPQLTLVDNFSKAIMRNSGSIGDIEAWTFYDTQSKYSVFRSDNKLVFVTRRYPDKRNNAMNRGFGPVGCQCPGRVFTDKAVRSILVQLQSMDISVDGKPIETGTRFRRIVNKDSIKITFRKARDAEVVDTSEEALRSVEADLSAAGTA